jgi:hypothetical protein
MHEWNDGRADRVGHHGIFLVIHNGGGKRAWLKK